LIVTFIICFVVNKSISLLVSILQTGTEVFSVGDEKYWSTTAASAVSALNNNNNNDRLTAFDPGQPG